MSYLINATDDAEGLLKLLRLIIDKGQLNGNYKEVLNCLLAIQYDNRGSSVFRNFKNKFFALTGQIGEKGWYRATRVYTTIQDLPTKPSYLKRLIEYPDRHRRANKSERSINQLNTIIGEFIKKPGYSILSFVFLRPADLIDKFRPGYVPCPIAGDFKFRNGRFHLNVMFRTSDAFAVGYADIYYLRKLQMKIFSAAKEKSENKKICQGEIGNLNLYFTRTYIKKYDYIVDGGKSKKRIEIIPLAEQLIKELENISIEE